MTTWFTADLHFGHANIIKYCERPFVDVDDMNSRLINNWNATVSEGDTVWVLGDVALGSIAGTLPLVNALTGYKILVPSNHDRCWHVHERWAQNGRMINVGVDANDFRPISEEAIHNLISTGQYTPPGNLSR